MSNDELKYLKEKTENLDSPQSLTEPLLSLFNEILKIPYQLTVENQKQRTKLTALEILSKGNLLISSKYNKLIEEIAEMYFFFSLYSLP